MINVTISEFRANLLKYLKIVQHGEKINVTSKGTPLATLTPPPFQFSSARQKLKKLAKTARVNDVLSPVATDWEIME